MSKESVEKLFEQWLAQRSDGRTFDELCLAHPELTSELRRVHARWLLDEALRFPGAVPSAGLPREEAALRDRESVPRNERRIGEFKLIRRIGRGGMGEVWMAEQETLKRVVAIKFLNMRGAPSRADETRFMNEARVAARLQHPHIVPVYSADAEGGEFYYVMEYVHGVTLDQVIRSLRTFFKGDDTSDLARLPSWVLEWFGLIGTGGESSSNPTEDAAEPVPDPNALTTGRISRPELQRKAVTFLVESFVPVLLALDYAHRLHVVHGDVKPSNLMFDRYGRLRVLDFGLAHLLESSGEDSRPGPAGTPRFMSPELVAGSPGGLSPAIDIYALGATLYECVTLRPLYDGTSQAHILQKITTESPVPPRVWNSRIHRHLERIILKAVSRQPKQRYPSAEGMAVDLQRFLHHQPLAVGTTTSISLLPSALARAGPRTRAVLVLVALAVLVAGQQLLGRFLVRGERAHVQAAVVESRRAADEAEFVLATATRERDESGRVDASLVPRIEAHLARARSTLLAARHRSRDDAVLLEELGTLRRRAAAIRVLGHATVGDMRSAWETMESAKRQGLLDDAIHQQLESLHLMCGLAVTTEKKAEIEITVRRIDPTTKEVEPTPILRGSLPFETRALLAGDYHLTLTDASGRTIQFPVRLRSAERSIVQVPYLPAEVDPDLQYVACYDEEFFVIGDAMTLHGNNETGSRLRTIPEAFFLERFEVTNRKFFEFYNDPSYRDHMLAILEQDGRDLRADELAALWNAQPSDWELGQPMSGTEDKPVRWNRWSPSWGASEIQARAYARWKERELPTELQWEKAARGLDGRIFPSGDRFNPAHYFSHALMDVGSFPGDVSVYGIHDMMGSLSEFVFTKYGQRIRTRGGIHWMEEPSQLRLAARLSGQDVGFRCALSGARSLLVNREPL